MKELLNRLIALQEWRKNARNGSAQNERTECYS